MFFVLFVLFVLFGEDCVCFATNKQNKQTRNKHLAHGDGGVEPVLHAHAAARLQGAQLLLLGVGEALELGAFNVRAGRVERLGLAAQRRDFERQPCLVLLQEARLFVWREESVLVHNVVAVCESGR